MQNPSGGSGWRLLSGDPSPAAHHMDRDLLLSTAIPLFWFVEAEQSPSGDNLLAPLGEARHGLSSGLGPCEGVAF